MKKNIKIILFASIVVIIGFVIYAWFNLLSIGNASQKAWCKHAENTGWAPAWDQTGCDGEKLSEDSPLIENEYTCYCHTPNTCWNGRDCVSMQK